MKQKNPWKTLASKTAYKNPRFKITEHKIIHPDGKPGIYYVLRNKPAVFVVPLTDKNKIFLVGLHRYPTNMFSWEIPGGGVDGQKPLTAAKRELWEEAGLKAKAWKQVGTFQSFNGMSDEISYTFVAKQLRKTKTNKQKEEGISKVTKVSFKKVLQMIKNGQLTDGQSISALMQAGLYLGLI